MTLPTIECEKKLAEITLHQVVSVLREDLFAGDHGDPDRTRWTTFRFTMRDESVFELCAFHVAGQELPLNTENNDA